MTGLMYRWFLSRICLLFVEAIRRASRLWSIVAFSWMMRPLVWQVGWNILMARTMAIIVSMHVCLNLFCVCAVTLCGLRCGVGASMRMIRKTARRPMKWELLWVHPTMNLWRAIIRSGRENVKSMVRGIMLPTRKWLTAFFVKALNVPLIRRTW